MELRPWGGGGGLIGRTVERRRRRGGLRDGRVPGQIKVMLRVDW